MWNEILNATEVKPASDRKDYVSESAYIRCIKRQVDTAVRIYIRNRAENSTGGRSIRDHNNQLPAKVEILALRYTDPCTFNRQIAAVIPYIGLS